MPTTTTSTTTNRATPRPAAAGRCSLKLSINGTAYAVRPFRHEAFGIVRAFTLTAPGREPYTIASTIEGPSCDCADFEFRRAGLDPAGCKHIRAARAVGLL